ncbi:phage major tail tube protein [Sphingomonas jatrophae]|uniref:Phage major tail tube protein n=1 Tax=Sphingomonas jatrophae TaxID=1166337 RepID=A0A1I6JLH5_9SPHN|nr:phage major tail tube protein [Sphingomonas jatrophae]SFR79751.1 hypothetical protein SAMN05192580_0451 [Sphingomonas jatrophae]
MLPRKLKDLLLFNEGGNYLGEVNAATLPKLTRKLEEWRGAGMDSPVKIDMGGEALDLEWTAGGPLRDVLAQYAEPRVDGLLLRFVGVYEADDTGEKTAVEVIVRGRHEEIEAGEQKIGEGGEFKVKTSCAYYRLDWNGSTVIEVDPLNMVLIVDGNDRMAERRAILGV